LSHDDTSAPAPGQTAVDRPDGGGFPESTGPPPHSEPDRLVGAAVGITMIRYDMAYPQAAAFLHELATHRGESLLDLARAMTVSRWPPTSPLTRSRPGTEDFQQATPDRDGPEETASGRLLDLLTETTDLRELLDAVTELAVETVPGCDSASITVIRGDEPATMAFSDARALAIDETQYSQGQGPCLLAARTDDIVEVDDLTTSPADEPWRQAAIRAGITATLSLPIASEADIVAALNLYSSRPDGWPASSRAIADDLATYTGDVVTVAYRYGDLTRVQSPRPVSPARTAAAKAHTEERAQQIADLAGRIAETETEVARVHDQLAQVAPTATRAAEAAEQAARARRFAEHEKQEQQRWDARSPSE
jgi:hypothetical protein